MQLIMAERRGVDDIITWLHVVSTALREHDGFLGKL